MIKTLSIAISAMVVLLVSFFSDPEPPVTVTTSVSPHLTPGEDCIVKVTLSKSKTAGYARLQQILPQGLTATPIETMGATFEMEDNVVKFIWQDLPGENSFTISYKIQTDPNETEIKTVPGTLYYVENNLITKTPIDPMQLNFTPSAGSASNAEVERKIIAVTPESGDYKVELAIQRKSGEQSARFIDNIPEGYTVTDISTGGATYVFSNSQAIFKWDVLPPDSVINISYRLNATGQQFEKPLVTGMLVYGNEGENKTNSNAASTTASASLNTTPDITPDPQTATDAIAANLAEQEAAKSSVHNMAPDVPVSQKGIFFKVQIAATKKSPLRSDKYFQGIYHFGQHVDLTEQEGWRKYMIGNFDTYASAVDFSQRTKEKIPDAFVVAYRNAERITIKEALSTAVKGD
jgi:hypothetical protein